MLIFNRKKRVIFLICSYLYVVIATILYAKNEYISLASIPKEASGLNFFYGTQGSFSSALLFFFYISVMPFLYSHNIISAKNNHFDNLMITRLGSQKRYRLKAIVMNIVYSGGIFLSYRILELVVSVMIINPINFTEETRSLFDQLPYVFSTNAILNLVFYLILSTIGAMVFASFILSIGLFLKNSVLYYAVGLIVSLFFSLVPALLMGLLNIRSFIGSLFMNSVSFDTLFTPGIRTIGSYAPKFNAWVPFAGSVLFFGLVTFILYKVWDQYYDE